MAKLYILMAEKCSPIAFRVPYPVCVFSSLKEAKAERDKRMSSNPVRLNYFVEKADDMTKVGND